MKYPKVDTVGTVFRDPSTGMYRALEIGRAYRDDDPIVRANQWAFQTVNQPVRPGYGQTISAGSRRRQSVPLGGSE